MPYNPHNPFSDMEKVLNELGADPGDTRENPNWPDIQQENCLDVLPDWFVGLMDLKPSSVAHLNDDVPNVIKETARKLFVGCIAKDQPVEFRMDPSGEFGVNLEDLTGEQVIVIHTPAVAQPA